MTAQIQKKKPGGAWVLRLKLKKLKGGGGGSYVNWGLHNYASQV